MLSAALVARIFFVCHVNAEGSIHRSEQTDEANDMIGARHRVLVVADVLHAVEAWAVEEAFACFVSTLMARSPEQNGSTRARSRRVESMFPFATIKEQDRIRYPTGRQPLGTVGGAHTNRPDRH